MALVDYSDSDEDSPAIVNQHESKEYTPPSAFERKRKHSDNNSQADLPPLPKDFHNLYASATRVSTRDDPSLHGGRKRATPHVEGNWPTHIYIEWFPCAADHQLLDGLYSAVKDAAPPESDTIHSFLTSDLGTPLPLHVSLSRPIVFNTEKKDDFHDGLKIAIESSQIRPFDLIISGLDWVSNFEGNRWFLVLRVKSRAEKSEENELNNLLQLSNTVVQDYGQPPLYTNIRSPLNSPKRRRKGEIIEAQPGLQDVTDAFHISIAWTLGKPGEKLPKAVISQLEEVNGIIQAKEDVKAISVKVDEVKIKIGNTVTSIPLKKQGRIAEGKLFGF